MKNYFNNSLFINVVKASTTTNFCQGFCPSSRSIHNMVETKINQWKSLSFLIVFLFFASILNAFAVSTLSCITTQNGKTAIITCRLSPWIATDNDFADPYSTDVNVVSAESISKSTIIVNGVPERQMIVQVNNKKAGDATIIVHQIGGQTQNVDFKLFPELFSISIPNHMNDGEFMTNGFHPGEVFLCMLKIIDTETGNDNLNANGVAPVNIIGNGFSFNGGAMAQTVNFINGLASVTIHANQPNSGYCYFRISDDTLPASIGGSDILHTAMISLSSPILGVSCSTTGVSCGAVNNGSATVTVTGGTLPYLYSCSNGILNSNSPVFTGLTAGTYTAIVTDYYGATFSSAFTISPPPALTINATVNQPFCSPNGLGSIQVLVAGAGPSINYLWNDGNTLDNRTNLLPGNFTVTASDINGCNGLKTINVTTVNQPPVIICPSDITVNTEPGKNYAFVKYHCDIIESCIGYVDISIYPVSGSAFNKGITTVTCMATDGNNQTATCYFNVIVNDDEAPVAKISDATVALNSNGNATVTNALLNDSSSDNCGILSKQISPNTLNCSNIGPNAVTMTVTDGNNYYWIIDSNQVKYFNSSHVLIMTITTAGRLSVLVTKDGGFIVSDSGSVRIYAPNGTLKATLFTSNHVTVIITDDGGFVIIDLDNGSVKKCDKNGVVQYLHFTSNNVSVVATPDGGFIIIDKGNGIVKICDKDGNVKAILFSSENVTVLVTSDGGFIIIDKGTGAIKVCDKDGNIKSVILSSNDVTVILTSDGGFVIIDRVNGSVKKCDKNGVVQYLHFTSNNVSVVATPDGGFILIDKGTGTIKVCDKDGIVKSIIFTSNDVTVVLTSDGGFVIIDKGDGIVKLCDKDGNVKSVIFTSLDVIVVATTDGGFIVNDAGNKLVKMYDKNSNHKATIFTSGNVTITITPDGGFIVNDINEHLVKKYDKNGNLLATIFTSGNVTITITPNGGFIVNDADGHWVKKFDKDGNLQSTISTSGTTSVIPDANGGFKVIDNLQVRVYNKEGTLINISFTICASSVYTNKSLSSSDTSNVIVLNPIALSGVVTNVNCSGIKSGKITLTVSGISGPYTYLWSNGKTTKSLTGLAAGTYTVAVADAHGCNNSISKTVIQPTAIVVAITKTTIKCNGSSTGSAKATATGGTPPYTFSWNTIPVKTGANVSGLSASTYTVTVTDGGGCTKTKSVTIVQNQLLSVVILQSFDHATAIPAGGVGPYTYSWNTIPVQTTSTATGLTCGNVSTVTVTDSKGCTKQVTFTLACPRLSESNTEDHMKVNVFPNPTTGLVNLAITNADFELYSIELIDVTGRIVYSSSSQMIEGYYHTQLDLSTYSDGLYSLRISSGNKVTISKIMLQKNK